jgi:pyruvate/2-oxoglutarate dehydrogenase complex dihydrolipoamide acyltransferase (E2) component
MSVVAIPMPKVDQTMEEGTLLEWLVAVGDEVAVEDVVAVIQTDKVDMEVETYAAGRITALLVEPGVTVAVGTPLCELEVVAP